MMHGSHPIDGAVLRPMDARSTVAHAAKAKHRPAGRCSVLSPLAVAISIRSRHPMTTTTW